MASMILFAALGLMLVALASAHCLSSWGLGRLLVPLRSASPICCLTAWVVAAHLHGAARRRSHLIGVRSGILMARLSLATYALFTVLAATAFSPPR
jgi:hypothetical protein